MPLPNKRRYTVFVQWPEPHNCTEEIDVDALTSDDARKQAYEQIVGPAAIYIPGGKIIRVMERFGLYL